MGRLRPWHLVIAAAFLAVPSAGVVQKYLGTVVALAYVAAAMAAGVASWQSRRRIQSFLGRDSLPAARATAVLLVAGFTVAFLTLYPVANAGRASWLSPSGIPGGGSDRDEALNLGARAILDGRNPFAERTHLDNPISQLPGSFVLAMPFAVAGNAAWQTLFWFPVWLLTLSSLCGGARAAAAIAGVTLVASPVVMQDLVTGGDLATNSIVVLTLVAGVRAYPGSWLVMGLAGGIALATRVPFVLLAPAVFMLVRAEAGRAAAVGWIATTLGTATALTLPFYLVDAAAFTPLEVQNKFLVLEEHVPWAATVLPAVAVGFAGVAAIVARRGLGAALVAAAFVLSVPPAVLLVAMRLAGSWNLNPAVYVMPGLFFALPGLWLLATPVPASGPAKPVVVERVDL